MRASPSNIRITSYALLQYGALSPIGIRQEKMLRDAMTEILNLTTQSSPLDVKVPLYHGSAKTVFNQVKTEEGIEAEPTAPLPHFSDEQVITNNGASPPAPNRAIPVIPTVPIVPSISSIPHHQHHYSSSVETWQSQQQQQQQMPLAMSHSPQMQMQVPLAMSQSPQMQMHAPAQQQPHVRTNSYGGGY